jgi:hypothetical protein
MFAPYDLTSVAMRRAGKLYADFDRKKAIAESLTQAIGDSTQIRFRHRDLARRSRPSIDRRSHQCRCDGGQAGARRGTLSAQ